jgi:hypothetical protein
VVTEHLTAHGVPAEVVFVCFDAATVRAYEAALIPK